MIKLLADSTCDLSDEILRKYNIDIAPLSITIDGKTYRDRIDINADQFFSRMAEFKAHPTTAMPSPANFIELYEKAYQDGYKEILCICMSSKTSGSYQSAEIAKTYFEEEHTDKDYKIHVVDSTSMSHGSGWLLMKSARLIEKGISFDDLVHYNETHKRNVKHFLSVDDLDNLVRSGRLRYGSALIGKIMKVKPIMTMKQGEGAIVSKERGRKAVLSHYLNAFKMRVDLDETDFVIIGYSSDRLYAENLVNLVKDEAGFQGEIYVMQMGVAVGTHVGLGGLSFYFMEKPHLRDGLIINNIEKIKDVIDKGSK